MEEIRLENKTGRISSILLEHTPVDEVVEVEGVDGIQDELRARLKRLHWIEVAVILLLATGGNPRQESSVKFR